MTSIANRTEDLTDIADKVWAGERLSFEDGLRLFRTQDLLLLGSLADLVRMAERLKIPVTHSRRNPGGN